MKHITGNGEYEFEIVGESHYQQALVRIAGSHTADGRRVKCSAALYLEPNNPHDRNAVRVEIDGATVGHVARDLAPIIRQELGALGISTGQRVGVDALILGGRTGQSYGVWLDIPFNESEEDEEDEEDEGQEEPDIAPPVIKPTKYGASVSAGWTGADEPKPHTPRATTPIFHDEERQPAKKSRNFIPWWGWALVMALGAVVLYLVVGSMG